MFPKDSPPLEQVTYPLEMLLCQRCGLAQLGSVLPREVVFPASYPYTSSTTRVLRENFADLSMEAYDVGAVGPLLAGPGGHVDLVVDIGGNDGNLLSNFEGYRRLNITPEDNGRIGEERGGIPWLQDYFGKSSVNRVIREQGQAQLITATNVFAHVDDVHGFVEHVHQLLDPKGVFCVEAHYLPDLLKGVQYDTIYHEHQRYYSLRSLNNLLRKHGLEVFRVKRIPTHGGSIRVWVARHGQREVDMSVMRLLVEEEKTLAPERFKKFAWDVEQSKLDFWRCITNRPGLMHGVGAPSRSTVLVNYLGIDAATIPLVYEVEGSHRIGKCIPGTRCEVVLEASAPAEFPHKLLLLSHHVADELIETFKRKGFRGSIISPLPNVLTTVIS